MEIFEAVDQREKKPSPPYRKLKIYAFDPAASLDMQTAVVNTATVTLPWEDLEAGPKGEYVEVVDIDPASGGFYLPVDLNDPDILVQAGLSPSDGNPKFHQQMVYAVAMMTIKNFERALGRKVIWAPRPWGANRSVNSESRYVGCLRIYPHALREANAYYSPQKVALLFGYFRASDVSSSGVLPGGTVFTCLSHDIVAHETTHAILDGMHRRFIEASNPDSLAFHEAFADIVALFQHFTIKEAVQQQIFQLRGDLSQKSLISALASQFGHAIGHYSALRDAVDALDADGLPDAGAIERISEPHERGAILVAAVFDAFLSIYRSRVADLLRLSSGDGRQFPDRDLHPDLAARLTDEATKAAGHVLRMCIRALDYLPPVDITFGDYLRAIITADIDLVSDDSRGYRIAMIEAFRRRGIFPRDCRSLSVDSLVWQGPEVPIRIDWLENFEIDRFASDREAISQTNERHCGELFNWFWDNAEISHAIVRAMGLWLRDDAPKTIRRRNLSSYEKSVRGPDAPRRPAFDIHSVRVANRVGPEGQQEQQLIIEITQERRGYMTADLQAQVEERGRISGVRQDFVFRGGATLVVDLQTRDVRYCIVKDIVSEERLSAQRKYQFGSDSEALGSTYFGMSGRGEPFAFVHRML